MIVIRTAEDMARALDSPLDPELKRILTAHFDRLSVYDGYDLAQLAEFVIAEAGDTLSEIEAGRSQRLVTVGGGAAAFAVLPETVGQHGVWLEVVFILSDDGFGLVLLAELGERTDPLLASACQHALQHILHDPCQ